MLDKLKEKLGLKVKEQENEQGEVKLQPNETCNAKECICVKQQLHANVRKHCLHYGVK